MAYSDEKHQLILVVDDIEMNRAVIKAAFDELGMDIMFKTKMVYAAVSYLRLMKEEYAIEEGVL